VHGRWLTDCRKEKSIKRKLRVVFQFRLFYLIFLVRSSDRERGEAMASKQAVSEKLRSALDQLISDSEVM